MGRAIQEIEIWRERRTEWKEEINALRRTDSYIDRRIDDGKIDRRMDGYIDR